MKLVYATAAALLAGAVTLTTTSAHAYCSFGYQNRPGSLGPGRRDNSRFYTVTGGARVGVEVENGGPIRMNLGCGWRTGWSHYCYRGGSGRKFAQLRNVSGQQVTYRWICTD